MRRERFEVQPLEAMAAVGLVTEHSARLWFRARRPGIATVRVWTRADESAVQLRVVKIEDDGSDWTSAITLGGEDEPLAASTVYQYQVTGRDGHLIGRGVFETDPSPDAVPPEHFSFALVSCNQPFDAQGRVRASARQMLLAMHDCFALHRVKRVFMVGDQIYADYPPNHSLFDDEYFKQVGPPKRSSIFECNAAEVRRLYQRRHRYFWALPEIRRLQAEYPCLPILDDHDIIDNWGSNPDHQTSPWTEIGQGARMALFDYQAARVLTASTLPSNFHFITRYANTATFVMDLRSERHAGDDGRLFCDAQLDALRLFLQQHRDLPVVFVVFSVPIVHLPRALARAIAKLPPKNEDFSDRWSSGRHLRDRDKTLRLLHQHMHRAPDQKIVLLSGDIHIACAHSIELGEHRLYQLVSSPLTHSTGPLIGAASKLLMRMNRSVLTEDGSLGGDVRLLKGSNSAKHNPFAGLNVGIVDIQNPPKAHAPTVRYFVYGHDEERPVRKFVSRAL